MCILKKKKKLTPEPSSRLSSCIIFERIVVRVRCDGSPARDIRHEILAELLHLFDGFIWDPN
jgi:hypothetical protein